MHTEQLGHVLAEMQSLARQHPGRHVVSLGAEPRPGDDRARAAVAAVVDPEMPMLTLDDLGVVRGVEARTATRSP